MSAVLYVGDERVSLDDFIEKYKALGFERDLEAALYHARLIVRAEAEKKRKKTA